MTVGLILVSHSADLARGSAELAQQMAPSVLIAPAGGADGGGIGTSFDAITAAIDQADSGDGAVLLYDLGSALMTAETALEFLEPEVAQRIRIVDAPLVEGALAAAVTAEGGGDLDAVAASALSAGEPAGMAAHGAHVPGRTRSSGVGDADVAPGGAPGDGAPAPDIARDQSVTATVSVVNPLGLHARPVATLIRALAGLDVQVTLARPGGPTVDLRAVLRVVALALRGGDQVEVVAHGPGAAAAAATITALISGGFGETSGLPKRIPAAGMGAASSGLCATTISRGRAKVSVSQKAWPS